MEGGKRDKERGKSVGGKEVEMETSGKESDKGRDEAGFEPHHTKSLIGGRGRWVSLIQKACIQKERLECFGQYVCLIAGKKCGKFCLNYMYDEGKARMRVCD